VEEVRIVSREQGQILNFKFEISNLKSLCLRASVVKPT
jgi:hypothetical protein